MASKIRPPKLVLPATSKSIQDLRDELAKHGRLAIKLLLDVANDPNATNMEKLRCSEIFFDRIGVSKISYVGLGDEGIGESLRTVFDRLALDLRSDASCGRVRAIDAPSDEAGTSPVAH